MTAPSETRRNISDYVLDQIMSFIVAMAVLHTITDSWTESVCIVVAGLTILKMHDNSTAISDIIFRRK